MTNEIEAPVAWTFWSFETPGGPIMVAQCMHPEANGEQPDLPLDLRCEQHMRTVYYCLERGLWCDGGPPDYRWHRFDIVPIEHEPDETEEQ